MIFVTVGTHEQGFNRLIKMIDNLKGDGKITDEVFIQIGYSDYRPCHCQWSNFLNFEQMNFYEEFSTTIITHGGPASFMKVLGRGKIPIVVPRLKKYQEHVNDHQLEFAKRVLEKGYPILLIEDVNELLEAIQASKKRINVNSNNKEFNIKFNNEINELMC